MNIRYKKSSGDTFTGDDNIQYGYARTEGWYSAEKTWQQSSETKSVPTNRTGGVIKLRISSREMPDLETRNSTK